MLKMRVLFRSPNVRKISPFYKSFANKASNLSLEDQDLVSSNPISESVARNSSISKRKNARMTPPTSDSHLEAKLGTIVMPPLLRDRILQILRKEATKSRIGIEKFVNYFRDNQPVMPQGIREFPFTRGILPIGVHLTILVYSCHNDALSDAQAQ
jgi:hypothetical protein